ncbi:MAG: DUF2293 domain-containing protein [Rhizobiaceae bacterium]
MRRRLRALCPGITLSAFEAVLDLASVAHLRHLPPSIAIQQALTAHVRHAYTNYDQLLSDGYDPQSARHFVLDEMLLVLESWNCRTGSLALGNSDMDTP